MSQYTTSFFHENRDFLKAFEAFGNRLKPPPPPPDAETCTCDVALRDATPPGLLRYIVTCASCGFRAINALRARANMPPLEW